MSSPSSSAASENAGPMEEWSVMNSPSSGKTNASSIAGERSSASSMVLDDSHRAPLVAVIGVGYVGEHLVKVFSSHYQVVGYDVSEARIKNLRQGQSSKDTRVTFTCRESDLKDATYFLISVPTLLLPDNSINLSHLRSALNTVARNAHPGSTVVIESSVAVGMSRQLLGPFALSHGFFVGMSPERVDPGRISPPARAIPKIVSGLDDLMPGSLDRIARLYGMVFSTVVKVARPEVAEMTKLYENCQRMIAIAYANEMADACISHGIDPFEVAAAAATKPFGYLPVSPSIGVGGHCIPVNPFYLLSNCDLPLLRSATDKMARRPQQMAQRLLSSLAEEKVLFSEPINFRPRVLIVGLGFKAGQSHTVNSPGVELASALVDSGKVDIMFVDPLVEQAVVPNIPRLHERYWTRPVLDTFDSVVVATQQPGLDIGVFGELHHAKVENWSKPIR